MIDLGSRREFFWDDYLTESVGTTAPLCLHEPVPREKVFVFDAPWEGNACIYFNALYIPEDRKWRMYYLGMHMKTCVSDTRPTDVSVCCIESEDGSHWHRPGLGIKPWQDIRDTNIILTKDDLSGCTSIDNFFVTRDTHPAPAVPGRYKAVMLFTGGLMPDGRRDRRLISLVSEDGLRFRRLGDITADGTFDSLNTVHWNPALGKYLCYFRSFHTGNGDFDRNIPWNDQTRDIRVTFSDDFIHWSPPQRVEYTDGEDIPMYTNCVSPCPDAPHMLIGLPTRYTERTAWTPAFDRLCGAAARRERMEMDRRYGLALTDCAFMCSRDGVRFTRSREAFMRPGPEAPANWVYGICYPSTGFLPTPGLLPGSDDEWSFYSPVNHWMEDPAVLYRYTVRQDGFVSRHADAAAKTVLTRPFTFTGTHLTLNFSTSARGFIRVRLRAGAITADSGELFGDSICRIIDFDRDIASLAGQPVQMEVTLCDADLYSLRFR